MKNYKKEKMRKATYTDLKGKKFTVEYDEKAPCIWCGLPVESASMGGTNLCPACDCGVYRDGTKWTYEESMNQVLAAKRAKEIYEKMKEVK